MTGPTRPPACPRPISVIAPMHNEEGNVVPLYQDISKVMGRLDRPYEIIFVNDVSTDASMARMKELHCRDLRFHYVDLETNVGENWALLAGVSKARGNVLVTIDGDYQNDPAYIPALLDELERLRANYGQEAAHSMLRVMAQTLEHTLRPTDYVGRWNEDQFLTVLTGCSEPGLPAVCDRIRKMIAGDSIEWWGAELFAGRVSLGTAFPETGDTVETLLERVQHSLGTVCNSQAADAAAVGSGGEGPKS